MTSSSRRGRRRTLPEELRARFVGYHPGAAKAADNDASRDKLVKVIELWGAKKVFNSEQIEELKVAAKNEPVPVATVQDQRCDLSTIPVGVMAGLVKVALNGGHEPWRPLDLTTMPTAAPMPVEPGRLEARVKEFYRLLEKDKWYDEPRSRSRLRHIMMRRRIRSTVLNKMIGSDDGPTSSWIPGTVHKKGRRGRDAAPGPGRGHRCG